MSKLRVLTLTWNMSGEDTSRSTAEWKRSTVGNEWMNWIRRRDYYRGGSSQALDRSVLDYDVIVICLQEVHRKSEFAEFFLDSLNNARNVGKTPSAIKSDRYVMATAKNKSLARLAGSSFDQHLYLFYLSSAGFSVAKRGSTCFGAGGTCVKGSVAMHLHRSNEHYIFISSHFPMVSTGKEGDIARTAAYQQTEDKLILKMRTLSSETALSTDAVTVVWAGDFNYRTERIAPGMDDTILDNEKQGDRHRDRLAQLRTTGAPAPWPYTLGWRECSETGKQRGDFKPNYQPTCRFAQLKKTASQQSILASGHLRHEGWASAYTITKSGKTRFPSWCDRVFFKPRQGVIIQCKSNKFSTGSVESDHDAVFADLELNGVQAGAPIKQGLIQEWHDFMDELE